MSRLIFKIIFFYNKEKSSSAHHRDWKRTEKSKNSNECISEKKQLNKLQSLVKRVHEQQELDENLIKQLTAQKHAQKSLVNQIEHQQKQIKALKIKVSKKISGLLEEQGKEIPKNFKAILKELVENLESTKQLEKFIQKNLLFLISLLFVNSNTTLIPGAGNLTNAGPISDDPADDDLLALFANTMHGKGYIRTFED